MPRSRRGRYDMPQQSFFKSQTSPFQRSVRKKGKPGSEEPDASKPGPADEPGTSGENADSESDGGNGEGAASAKVSEAALQDKDSS